MTRETIVTLSKLWILVLVYLFGMKFLERVIGPVPAELIAIALAVLAIPIGLFCLIQARKHGKGITGHAIATMVIGALILAIAIPNFLHARDRARAKAGGYEQPK